MRKDKVIALAASAVLAGFQLESMGANASWVQTSGGPYSWVNDANWSASHPDGSAQIASFTGLNYSIGQLVTLDSNSITLGQLNIADSATAFFPVNISSGTLVAGAFTNNTLVFDNGASNAVLNNSGGTSTANNTISASISLNSNLSVVASTGVAGTFTLSGLISDGINGSKNINATGATTTGGTVIISGLANTYSGTTTVENGILQVAGDVISGTAGPLGNATSAIAIGSASSPAANSQFFLSTSNASGGTNTISRPLDFSGSNTNASATGNNVFQYVTPSANTGDALTISSGITLGTKRLNQIVSNHVGQTINLTGLITSAGAVSNGGPTNSVTFTVGATSGDTASGTATYRFANPNNNFSANISMASGTIIIANGSVPGNWVQGTQNTPATNELLQDSPIGHAGSSNGSSIVMNGGNGGNIISTNALTATRSVFLETASTYFGRNITIGQGSNTAGNGNYGTNSSNGAISEFNGYRFGGLNTTGEVNWRGDITMGGVNVGGFNKSIPVATNLSLSAATGGIINFTGRITDPNTVTSNASTGQFTSTVTNVTINGFRNNAYLDKNGDGIPDSGGAPGTNAGDIALQPVSTGIVRINNPNQSDYWAGTTEVMGGSLIINNVLGRTVNDAAPNNSGGTVTVDSGATIGGYGTLRSGTPGSTLDVLGTINPGDPTATTLTVSTTGVVSTTPTITKGIFTSEKPINFKAGSSLTLDLNSATIQTAGTLPSADRLAVTLVTSGTAINIDNTSLATTPLLKLNLNYLPLVNTSWTNVIDLAGSATYNGSFAVMVSGSPVLLTSGTTFPLTYGGRTYTITATFSGSTTNGNDLTLGATGTSGWAADVDGDYGTGSSWDAGVPTGTAFPTLANTALFGNVVSTVRNVTMNAFFYPQAVVFDATSNGSGYSITGTGSFGIATLTSNHGNSSVAVPISASGLISVLNDSQLTLSSKISGATGVLVSNTSHLTLGNPAASVILVPGNPNNSPAALAAVTPVALVNGYGGGTNVSSGQLTLVAPGAIPNFGALSIGATGFVNAADHGLLAKNNIFVSSLSLAGTTGAWTGKLDQANNDLVVQNGGIAKVTDQVKQGYNGGAWNGAGGIVSTSAASDTTHLTALGVILNSATGATGGAVLYSPSNATPNAFDNATAGAATDVLVKYTYYGDTNLDGIVDGSDYSRIDAAFASGTATGWFNGDFNYDGLINGSDYTLLDNAYNSQGAQLASVVASPTAQIGGSSGSSVPEPTTLGLIGIGAAGLLGRRRRRNSTWLAGAN